MTKLVAESVYSFRLWTSSFLAKLYAFTINSSEGIAAFGKIQYQMHFIESVVYKAFTYKTLPAQESELRGTIHV